jgi:hypothetical protein
VCALLLVPSPGDSHLAPPVAAPSAESVSSVLRQVAYSVTPSASGHQRASEQPPRPGEGAKKHAQRKHGT